MYRSPQATAPQGKACTSAVTLLSPAAVLLQHLVIDFLHMMAVIVPNHFTFLEENYQT